MKKYIVVEKNTYIYVCDSNSLELEFPRTINDHAILAYWHDPGNAQTGFRPSDSTRSKAKRLCEVLNDQAEKLSESSSFFSINDKLHGLNQNIHTLFSDISIIKSEIVCKEENRDFLRHVRDCAQLLAEKIESVHDSDEFGEAWACFWDLSTHELSYEQELENLKLSLEKIK